MLDWARGGETTKIGCDIRHSGGAREARHGRFPARHSGAVAPYTSVSWLCLDLDALAYGQAGTTLRPGRGWNASLFVTTFSARPSSDDDGLRSSRTSFVGARLTRNLSKTTRVSLDLINVFDKRTSDVGSFSGTRPWSYPGAADNFLFYPGETRGIRVRLRGVF